MAANKAESIFIWYFRFNGYFTTPNFTIHKDFKKKAGGGEADLLAVRFPKSKEEPRNYEFLRDAALILGEEIDFIIAEIKSSKCGINSAWQNKEYRNVQYAIRWMGFLEEETQIALAAEELYENGIWQSANKKYSIRMIACGNEIDKKLAEIKPNLLQIELQHVIQFLHHRFNTGCNQINRINWDEDIRNFAALCEKEHDFENLKKWILDAGTFNADTKKN